MATQVEIKGQKELYVALSTRIPYALEAKALQSALSSGARLIVDEAKANVGLGGQYPATRTGTLERAIYQSRGKKTTPTQAVRIVSVRKGKRFQKSNRDAYYGRWVEFGHRAGGRKGRLLRESTATTKKGMDRFQRRLVSSGKRRIRGERSWTTVPAHPYMGPARLTTQDRVQEVVLKRLQAIVEKAAQGKFR